MNHEHEQDRARTHTAATTQNHSVEPGQSSRTALLHRTERAFASGLVQRRAGEPGSDTYSIAPVLTAGLAAVQRKARDAGDVHTLAAEGISGPVTALPFLEQIQRSFGAHDVSGVQAHIGGPATHACHGMGARAYATGNHVVFREMPDLHTAAHEAAHIVQQRAGVQLKDGVGETGDAYETHADRVADMVIAGRSAESLLGGPNQGNQVGGPAETVSGNPLSTSPVLLDRSWAAAVATAAKQASPECVARFRSRCPACGGATGDSGGCASCDKTTRNSARVQQALSVNSRHVQRAEARPGEEQTPLNNEGPTALAADPAQCQACLLACSEGGEAFRDFCRSIPDPRLRAGCWALEFLGEVACKGWCYWHFCD